MHRSPGFTPQVGHGRDSAALRQAPELSEPICGCLSAPRSFVRRAAEPNSALARDMLRAMECEMSGADGLGFERKSETAVMIIADVQTYQGSSRP
jgi:hypothetical protein